MKVLIADDSSLSRKLVLRSLPASLTEDVSQAGNGAEVMAAYHAGLVELLFLDLTMPVMDGFETLEALKREEANVVVVVISADIQPLARQRVKELGAAAFVAKPVTAEAVFEALHLTGVL
ncbi:response regulator [Pseudomonas alliivorans]|uniref:response regulator n=1 Tax=Pseudomonas alliivorans TaxID=2810613 RepID=UPI00211D00BE|nr:response regulator [Pseudomonas alliivorans]MCQ9469324.1 response regulator [Pseudomonas alliivorans]